MTEFDFDAVWETAWGTPTTPKTTPKSSQQKPANADEISTISTISTGGGSKRSFATTPLSICKINEIGIYTYHGLDEAGEDDPKNTKNTWTPANHANHANETGPSGLASVGDHASDTPGQGAVLPVAEATISPETGSSQDAEQPALVDCGGIRRPVLTEAPQIDFERPALVPVDCWAGMVRLMGMQAPGGVPGDVWRGIQTDACHVMRDFGLALFLQDWTELEIFGCHRDRPLDRIPDCQGLIISLAGAKVETVRDNRKPTQYGPGDRHLQAATLKDSRPAFSRFYPRPADCIPLWGLK